MHNSKLIQLFDSFTDKEFKDFQKFLQQQVEKDNNIFLLFEIIKDNQNKINSAQLEKTNVFKKLFGNIKYQDVKVRELMSALGKQAEQFLILEEQQDRDFYNQFALLKQFRKRDLSKQFTQQVKTLENIIEKDIYINSENHKREFLLADEKNNFFEKQQIRAHDEAISLKNENFDKYYYSTKLKNLCELINRQNILNADYKTTLAEDIIRIVKQNKNVLLDVPAIHCYYEIYHLLKTENNETQFNNTFNVLNKFQKCFTDAELKSMYAYLLNYCIQHVNKGVLGFTAKLFELQKLLLQSKVLLENNQLSHISYRNIVSIAIKLKEYEWAEKFIENYKDLISENHKENAYNLSKSNIFYAQNNFEATVSLLNDVDFTDVYYACTSKFTLLKAYYALKEMETLEYFVSSFQLYLKRNKEISLNFKKSSENFLKHFKKLLLIVKQLDFKENDKIDKKIKSLKSNISAEKIMANKAWLLEEIDKIKI